MDYDFGRRLRKAGRLALLDELIWVSNRRWRTSGLLPTLWSWFWVQGLYVAGVEPERLAGLYRPVRVMSPLLIHLAPQGASNLGQPLPGLLKPSVTQRKRWEYEKVQRR